MVWETGVQSQVESYQRLKKCYLIPPGLTLSIIWYGSKVKWCNPGKEVASFPTPWGFAIEKGAFGLPSTTVTNLTFLYIYSSKFSIGEFTFKTSLLISYELHCYISFNVLYILKSYPSSKFSVYKMWKSHMLGLVVIKAVVELAQFGFTKKLGVVSMEAAALAQSCVSLKTKFDDYGECCTWTILCFDKNCCLKGIETGFIIFFKLGLTHLDSIILLYKLLTWRCLYCNGQPCRKWLWQPKFKS